jgi:Protein of unknown function (DUF3093)
MREYRERLGAPASWWLGAAGCVLLFGTTLWAGYSPLAAAAVYAGLGAACAAVLLAWGGARVEVAGGELRAGRERLALRDAGQVAVLTKAQARELRGPSADPAAYLLIRPYVKGAVYVEVAGRPLQRPYWLISTRRPAELAAAIEGARAAAGQLRSWHDVARDHAADAGARGPAGQAGLGEESDAC